MPDIILLSFAVCIDSFAAALSCAVRKIKIPFVSAFVISVISAVILAVGLFLCTLVGEGLGRYASSVSAVLLLTIGIISFFDFVIKRFIDAAAKKAKGESCFLVEVYLDKTKADRDNSKRLSPKEAVIPAITLSIDSLGVGLSAGLSMPVQAKIVCILLCIVLCTLFVMLGSNSGKKLVSRLNFDFSFLSGIILIILALMKI